MELNAPLQSGKIPGISTPISISLEEHLTPDEREQILQTIEMFEAIAKASPDDYQSLEILKEAYWKIGRQADSIATARQLADAYRRLGQYSSALLEYEGVLQQEISPAEGEAIRCILVELEEKLHPGKSTQSKGAAIALDFGVEDLDPLGAPGLPNDLALALDPASAAASAGLEHIPVSNTSSEASLIATDQTRLSGPTPRRAVNVSLEEDGNEPLAKFLVQHRLVNYTLVNSALARVRAFNSQQEVKEGRAVAASLLNEVANAGADIEPLLCGIIDRTKTAYIPLEQYDVDRQIVKMLPDHLTLGRVIVPFDVISRTMMIASDNPFDTAARAVVQQSVDYHIQWHLAKPDALQKILRDAYRIRS